MANINVNNIRVGYIIQFENKLWRITAATHIKPGKGGAFMQITMKDIINGTKMDHRFRSEESVDKVFLDAVEATFLYTNRDESFEVINSETFETITISNDLLGDNVKYLTEGMKINLEMLEGRIISISIPEKVVAEVQSTQPNIKGQTVTATYKPALLTNGKTVQVPPFVGDGDKIIVKTEDDTYVERAK